MNTFQKVIKYAAMTLAILLTIGIISGIVGLVIHVVAAFSDTEEYMKDARIDFVKEFDDVEQLYVKNGIGKLTIKSGDSLKVEGRNVSKNFKATVKNGTLIVEEEDYIRKFLWFEIGRPKSRSTITVYIPHDFTAGKIEVESGAGEVVLEDFSAEKLVIDAGVGNIYGQNITAQAVKGSGGVGDITFYDVNLSNIDFDSGVGNLKIEGIISGNSEFDCGVGNIKLTIKGNREDYAIRCNSGVGSIRVNGEKVSSDYKDSYSSAAHSINIDGGVGNVNIDFID